MTQLSDDVRILLTRELRGFQRELALFPDDASIWRTVPGVTNPAGTLARHVAGNLRHYVGAVLGDSGYVRDRPAEFAQRTGTRDELHRELGEAMTVVDEVLGRLPAGALDHVYPDAAPGVTVTTRRFLLHLCAHAAMHLGQAGYVRRALTGDARSAGPTPQPELNG